MSVSQSRPYRFIFRCVVCLSQIKVHQLIANTYYTPITPAIALQDARRIIQNDFYRGQHSTFDCNQERLETDPITLECTNIFKWRYRPSGYVVGMHKPEIDFQKVIWGAFQEDIYTWCVLIGNLPEEFNPVVSKKNHPRIWAYMNPSVGPDKQDVSLKPPTYWIDERKEK